MPREFCVRVQGKIRHVTVHAVHPTAHDVLQQVVSKWPALRPLQVPTERLRVGLDGAYLAHSDSLENVPALSILNVEGTEPTAQEEVLINTMVTLRREMDALRAECDTLRWVKLHHDDSTIGYLGEVKTRLEKICVGLAPLGKICDEVTGIAHRLRDESTTALAQKKTAEVAMETSCHGLESRVRELRAVTVDRLASFHTSTRRYSALLEERKQLKDEVFFLEQLLSQLESYDSTETILSEEVEDPVVEEALGLLQPLSADMRDRVAYLASAPRVDVVSYSGLHQALAEVAYGGRDRVVTAELSNMFARMKQMVH